jgi:hypothetical protein
MTLFSTVFTTKQNMALMLPVFNEQFYIDFMEILIFSKDISLKKALIMQPLPPQIGQLYF